ncbi:MAG: phosphate ABC transporter permease subunit PstC [Pseudomonadota bacterium]
MTALAGFTPYIVMLMGLVFFFVAKSRAVSSVNGQLVQLHSRPAFHGLLNLLWVFLVGLILYFLILIVGRAVIDGVLFREIMAASPDLRDIEADLVLADAKSLAQGNVASRTDELRETISDRFASLTAFHRSLVFLVPFGAAVGVAFWQLSQIKPEWRARNRAERILRGILFTCAAIAILTTIGIVISLIFETVSFFSDLGWRIDKFLFGTNWTPLAGVSDGKIDADRVGAVPLFVGTLLITLIAMLVAVPIGLFAAIYLSDFASPQFRAWAKPMLEILAGIPTVVYGFFAAITMAPFIRGLGENIGLSVASESALAAGVVMGIMIIPFISSLSDDVINAVPQSLRDGSYGLGATKAETIRQVVLPAALPGIVSAVLLGISRAVGETMIVVMAAGQGANLTVNPLEAVTTVTVQIVMLITGDTEAATAAGPAFTLGFTLFCVTLALNVFALRTVRKYRELYD